MATKEKTTVLLDRKLAGQAAAILGTSKTTETINEALGEIVRREQLKQLAQESIAHSEAVGPENLIRLRDEAWRRGAPST